EAQRSLSSKEMELRRKVLEQAQEAQQQERQKEEEREARWRGLGKKRSEEKAAEGVAPVTEEGKKEGVTWKDKLRRKKKHGDAFEEEEESETAKGAKKKGGRRSRAFEDDEYENYESLAPSEILAEEAFDPNEARLILEEE